MKKYTLPIEKETAIKLQSIGAEIDSRTFLIDTMFQNHKDDIDSSVFESVPFKKYLEDYNKIQTEYNQEKNALTEILKKEVAKKENLPEDEVSFDWNIDDFDSCLVTITIR